MKKTNTNKTVQLSNWSVSIGSTNPYIPPEMVGIKLMGIVQGHPIKRDGHHVLTSRVVHVDGRFITTKSGTIYELIGDPCKDYLDFLQRTNDVYDPINPIRSSN